MRELVEESEVRVDKEFGRKMNQKLIENKNFWKVVNRGEEVEVCTRLKRDNGVLASSKEGK